MDADAPVLEALLITFTVATVGFVFIIGTFTVRRFISPLKLSVLAAFWAWGFIAVKRLYFWGQRNGRDQMFSLMEIHVYEISSFVMLLLLMLFYMRPNDLEGLPPSVAVSLKLFLVGLSITGNGMGLIFAGGPPVMSVFFPGDIGVFFIAIGLSVVIGGYQHPHQAGQGHMADHPLVVYILVLLTATYITGDWVK